MGNAASFKESFSSVTFSSAGQAILVSSSVISAISSGLVINFILRSQSKLKRPYHSIMFSMSFWDTVSSIAMATSTSLMPADVNTVYPFSGKAYGTVATCEAQGFIVLFGSGMTVGSSMMLNIYYVSTLLFKVTEGSFKKYFLPSGYVTMIICNFAGVLVFLLNDQINPTPYYPYCFVAPYPYDCNADSDSEGDCIRGGISQSKEIILIRTLLWFLIAGIFVLIISMALVIIAVFKVEREAKNYDNARSSNSKKSSDTKRTVLRQAIMYIGAFLLTWSWTLVSILAGSRVDYLKLFFQPLQGFFNALIFFHIKIGMLRKAETDLTAVEAVRSTLFSPSTAPEVILSRIEMVDDDTGPTADVSGEQWGESEGIAWPQTQTKMRRMGIITGNASRDADIPSASILDHIESVETPSAEFSIAVSSVDNSYANGGDISLGSRPTSSIPKDSKKQFVSAHGNRKFYRIPLGGWSSSSSGGSSHLPFNPGDVSSTGRHSQDSSVFATASPIKDIFSIAENEAESHGISYDSA